MITYPHAKINLGLDVIGKRPDGFHDIETVFYPVSLCDILEIAPATERETSITQTGVSIPGNPQDNLVLKAYDLLSRQYPLPPVSIHLHKIIPPGSGLGGGSSDAAFTFRILNEIFSLNLTDDILEAYARQAGSDCAFFIRRKPVFASGKGDRFESVGVDLTGYHILIVVPGIRIKTPEAYAMVHPQRPATGIREIIGLPVERWNGKLVNAFEAPVFRKYPEIAGIKDLLYASGAVYASLSGSGSAVFGIFRNEVSIPEEFSRYFTWQDSISAPSGAGKAR